MLDLIKILEERTLLKQSTVNSLDKITCLFCGFDPTAPSLHVGSMVPLMALRIAKNLGHKTICLIGGSTALIGDPTWKSETRPLLTKEDVAKNIQNIRKQMKRIANPDYIVNNADWFNKMTMVDFIRDACAHFSVNQMLAMETFENRLSNQGHLSLMEFMYTPMQAYDFAHLYKKYGCEVQCGGSDQFGNICQGIGYVKKVAQDSDPQGLTFNLLVNSKGEKMGKTVAGAVYLDDSMVSAYDFWQYFRNVDDADVKNVFLKLTELEVSEIDNLVAKDMIQAKKVLADEVTKLVHGPKKTLEARQRSENMFEKRDFDTANKVKCKSGTSLDEVSLLCGFVSSKSEAKNAIRAGSVTINGQKCFDPKFGFLKDGDVVCFGKKRFYKIIIC